MGYNNKKKQRGNVVHSRSHRSHHGRVQQQQQQQHVVRRRRTNAYTIAAGVFKASAWDTSLANDLMTRKQQLHSTEPLHRSLELIVRAPVPGLYVGVCSIDCFRAETVSARWPHGHSSVVN